MNNNSIFIVGNTASSKNGRIPMMTKGMRFPMLIDSDAVKKYKKIAIPQFEAKKNEFLKMIQGKGFPLKVEFTFIRDSRRLFDFINAAQIVQDLMVKHSWIPDDNYTMLIPFFNPEVIVNKTKAGVFIKIL